MNYVEAPRASQIAKESKVAIPRLSFNESPNFSGFFYSEAKTCDKISDHFFLSSS
jgi:hypothetical protein